MQNAYWFREGSKTPLLAGSKLPLDVATFCVSRVDSVTADLHGLSTEECGTEVTVMLLLSPVPLVLKLIKLVAEGEEVLV